MTTVPRHLLGHALYLACTPYERALEPQAFCASETVLVEGGDQGPTSGAPVNPIDFAVWTPPVSATTAIPVLTLPLAHLAPSRPLANLTVLYHVKKDHDWWSLGNDYIPGDRAVPDPPGLRGPIERVLLLDDLPSFTPLRDLGGTILMTSSVGGDQRYVAVESASHEIRWDHSVHQLGVVIRHFVALRTLVVGLYGDDADVVLGISLATGREVWRLQGGQGERFNRVASLWADEERGYIHGDRGVFAFDPATGVPLWPNASVDDGCGVVTGDGVLVIEAPGAHRRLDPAVAAELSPIAHRGTTCMWGRSPFYKWGVTPADLEGGQFVAFDPPDERGHTTLRAFDLVSGVERWHQTGFKSELLVADQDAVYVTRTGETLNALDAATGEQRIELSLGAELCAWTFAVLPDGGARGPLIFVTTDRGGNWLLGRADQPAVPESYRIRGRLAFEGTRRKMHDVAGTLVRVGDRRVRTDAAGRFEARGRALGAIAVDLVKSRGPDDDSHVVGDSRYFVTPPLPVVLGGDGTYHVEIELEPWFSEMDCH